MGDVWAQQPTKAEMVGYGVSRAETYQTDMDRHNQEVAGTITLALPFWAYGLTNFRAYWADSDGVDMKPP